MQTEHKNKSKQLKVMDSNKKTLLFILDKQIYNPLNPKLNEEVHCVYQLDCEYRKSFLAVSQTWHLSFCLDTSFMIHVQRLKFHNCHGPNNQVSPGQ